MPLPEPQPCMSQGCLFQKVTALGHYWEMASRTSQAEFSHILKSDESKRWVSLHAQKYWCASFLTQIKIQLGMERMKEEEMGAEEETCVCTGNEGWSSASLCLSWSHSSTPHSYKCPIQQATKQPPLWLWQTWATTSPLSQDFTSWDQKVSQQQALNSLGKLYILSAWARPWTTTVGITW